MAEENQKGNHQKEAKKGWFRRYLERLASENQRFGGKLCPS